MTKHSAETPFPPHLFEQAFERAPPPMQAPPAPPMRRRSLPIFTPKVVICAMFGALSAGYIAVAFTAPDMLTELAPAQTLAVSDADTQAAVALSREIGALRSSVAQLQSDVAAVKSEVDSTSARQTALANDVSTLSSRIATAPQTPAASPVATGEPPHAPKMINSDAFTASASALETGSVASPATAAAPAQPASPTEPVAFGAAVVKPVAKPVGIQISSGPTIEGLRVSWSLLADNYGAELKNLKPRFSTRGDGANATYDLVAGPVKTKAQAVKLCKSLAEKSVPCTVTEDIGAPL